jgi:hypothetical protein
MWVRSPPLQFEKTMINLDEYTHYINYIIEIPDKDKQLLIGQKYDLFYLLSDLKKKIKSKKGTPHCVVVYQALFGKQDETKMGWIKYWNWQHNEYIVGEASTKGNTWYIRKDLPLEKALEEWQKFFDETKQKCEDLLEKQ